MASRTVQEFFTPEFLARLERLSLVSRRPFRGRLTGERQPLQQPSRLVIGPEHRLGAELHREPPGVDLGPGTVVEHRHRCAARQPGRPLLRACGHEDGRRRPPRPRELAPTRDRRGRHPRDRAGTKRRLDPAPELTRDYEVVKRELESAPA